jgi:fatty-acyl-CoA synthase
MKPNPTTLIASLQCRAWEHPHALYARYLFPDRAPVQVTYGQTERRTRQFAETYAQRGIGKGDVVLVILPFHEDLMPAFYGAMWLGALPALLPFPTGKLEPAQYNSNLKLLLERTPPRAIMTDPALRDSLDMLMPHRAQRPALLVQDDVQPSQMYGDPAPHAAEDLAFMQYSSGSTGLQKGILLSHRATLAQIRGVGEFFALTDTDHILTWLPLYHDWGLIGVALHTLQLGTCFTLLSPMHWVTQPVVACEAIHAYRPTVYYQPNFAFNYMTKRVKDEEMQGLDLSSVRICCSGGEPCLYDSHQMFTERFRPWGFRPESFSIVYGAAEVTCGVFAAGPPEPIKVDAIDRKILQTEHRAQPVSEDDPNVMRLLGVGRPLTGTVFTILDEQHHELPERHVGEVVITSWTQFQGYYRNPEATARAHYQGWYLTGDLGYRVGNTLFVTGRKSDLIILGGVNIYPQDVEGIVDEHPDVVTGRVVAVGVDDPELGTQRLVVIAESRATDPERRQDIVRYIRSQVPLRLDVHVDRSFIAPYRWLIKTSSGKIARNPNYQRLRALETQDQ